MSALVRAAAASLQRDLGTVRVQGEIAAMTRASSGHWYFTLKDERAQVRCVMFRSRNVLVDFAPREGDAVEVMAVAGLYEARGEFQLAVDSLQRQGAGRLWEEFLRLRARLAAEGLFDEAHKRPLPPLPMRVGVVTSLQAAALRDVLTTLRRRAPWLQVVVYPVPVQGAGAAVQIAAMLARAQARAEVDVLLLVRGGGSLEDLWAFNEEPLARAIFACTLPVVVGVGHESDLTIADFVADLRAATPTAAAEHVTPEAAVLARGLAQALRTLARGAQAALRENSQRLDHTRRILRQPQGALQGLRQRLDERGAALQSFTRQRLRERAMRLDALRRALGLLDVQHVLDRGYALVRDHTGRVVSDVAQLQAGAALRLDLARGRARVRVEALECGLPSATSPKESP